MAKRGTWWFCAECGVNFKRSRAVASFGRSNQHAFTLCSENCRTAFYVRVALSTPADEDRYRVKIPARRRMSGKKVDIYWCDAFLYAKAMRRERWDRSNMEQSWVEDH